LADLGLAEWQEAVHWALTSEDVNNLAYAILVRAARDKVLVPAVRDIYMYLRELAIAYADIPMLSRTHGQPATPTTVGKELNVFAHRIGRANDVLGHVLMTGKLNGATGTYAAHVAALPTMDWIRFSQAFIKFLELEPTILTTQIEPHDTLVELCDALRRVNTILLDLDMDMWRYISDGYLANVYRLTKSVRRPCRIRLIRLTLKIARGTFTSPTHCSKCSAASCPYHGYSAICRIAQCCAHWEPHLDTVSSPIAEHYEGLARSSLI
jgi:hypothetical protein